MPCYDSRDNDVGYHTAPLKQEIKDLQDNLQWLEAVLCLLSSDHSIYPDFETYIKNLSDEALEKSGVKPTDVLRWYRLHNEADIKRKALEKLTDQEKKILGLIK